MIGSSSLHQMAYRFELTLMWTELEMTMTYGNHVRPRLDGSGLWWAQPMPANRNIDRRLLPQTLNAIRVGMGNDGVRGRIEVAPRDIRNAQDLCLTALGAHQLPSGRSWS